MSKNQKAKIIYKKIIIQFYKKIIPLKKNIWEPKLAIYYF